MSDILRPELPAAADAARARMTAAYCRDETEAVNELLAQAVGIPKATLASPEEAMQATGCVIGATRSASPNRYWFGTP